jgi:hypothetical protein
MSLSGNKTDKYIFNEKKSMVSNSIIKEEKYTSTIAANKTII